jgi:hypothetical protein
MITKEENGHSAKRSVYIDCKIAKQNHCYKRNVVSSQQPMYMTSVPLRLYSPGWPPAVSCLWVQREYLGRKNKYFKSTEAHNAILTIRTTIYFSPIGHLPLQLITQKKCGLNVKKLGVIRMSCLINYRSETKLLIPLRINYYVHNLTHNFLISILIIPSHLSLVSLNF